MKGSENARNITQNPLVLSSYENFYFSGTDVLNWRVPLEWNISEAYIENSKGQRIIDIKDSTLHVVNYSAPVDGYFSLTELKNHIYTIPTIKNAIPYTISYYKKNGFDFMFSTEVQEREYRNIDDEEPLRTRLMFYDLIRIIE